MKCGRAELPKYYCVFFRINSFMKSLLQHHYLAHMNVNRCIYQIGGRGGGDFFIALNNDQ